MTVRKLRARGTTREGLRFHGIIRLSWIIDTKKDRTESVEVWLKNMKSGGVGNFVDNWEIP